jgi:hypothetical protein
MLFRLDSTCPVTAFTGTLADYTTNENTRTRNHRKNKKGANLAVRALCSLTRAYLQPEHEAQHSADAQHDVCAAFTVLANPNAITAINKATFTVFIVFSFKKWKELRPRGRRCPH